METKHKPIIKIFVSHRIDKESEIFDNPLYVNVRCGAVFDKRKNVTMLGDDTGDNISKKRVSFCELTVLYWAWKNQDADYYGICHYRRYLSFSDKKFKEFTHPQEGEFDDGFGNKMCSVVENNINLITQKKYNLTESKMTEEIQKYDVICHHQVSFTKTPFSNGYESIKNDHFWHDIKVFDLACEILIRKYPHFKKYVDRFKTDKNTRMYSIFIMKKSLFFEYNEWLFSILFELEKHVDTQYYSNTKMRFPGAIAEKLFAIYMYYLYDKKKYRIKENQVVLFKNTEKEKRLKPAFSENNIPIFLSCSDYYVPYVGVFLKSMIMSSNKNKNYDVIILQDDISDENQQILKQKYEQSNISLRFYNPNNHELVSQNLSFYIADQRYSRHSYFKLFLPWIASEYDKVIVLDSDMICKEDIAELMDYSIENYLAGGVKDIFYQGILNLDNNDDLKYSKKYLKMENPYNYINTGVLLLNLKNMRSFYTIDQIQKYLDKKYKFRIQEQDLLNMLLEKHLLFLPLKWNYYITGNMWTKIWLLAAPAKECDYYKSCKNYSILHYASAPKPWESPFLEHADEFWEIARQTPFYEKIIYRTISNVHNSNQSQISGLSRLFGFLEKRVAKLERFFRELEERVSAVESFFRKLEERVSVVEVFFRKIEERVSAVEIFFRKIEERISAVESNKTEENNNKKLFKYLREKFK